MPDAVLAEAEVALPEPPQPEGAAAGPAGGDLPHIVTPCNAKPRLPEQPLLTGSVVGSGSWLLWKYPLSRRKFLPPDAVEGIEGLGHDARIARVAVSASIGTGVGHGPRPSRKSESSTITLAVLASQGPAVISLPGVSAAVYRERTARHPSEACPGKNGPEASKSVDFPVIRADRRETDLAGCALRAQFLSVLPKGHPGPGLVRRLEHVGHGRLLVGDQTHPGHVQF